MLPDNEKEGNFILFEQKFIVGGPLKEDPAVNKIAILAINDADADSLSGKLGSD